MKEKQRIKWFDVTKFLGIFAIYLGHFGKYAGKSFGFVFCYHVALFFFISGCTSCYDKEKNLAKYLKKKIKSIMIPFWGFSILSLVIYSIQNGTDLLQTKQLIMTILRGNIRNTFIASSLWFLSCLFMMEIVFKLLKYLKFKTIIFVICLGMFFIAEKVIVPRPIINPHWLYNVDSVFYYIIFFASGYILCPHLISLFKLDSITKKIIFIVCALTSFTYAILLYNGKNIIQVLIGNVPIISVFIPVITSLLLILLNVVIAKILENVMYFNKIGKETLYLCGNEYVIKTIFPSILELFSLKINLPTPLHTYIYTLVLLIVAVEIFIPIERRLLQEIYTYKINKKTT